MSRFLRRCRVTVGPSGGEGPQVTDEFRIAFRVRKDRTQDINSADVSIWGLSEDTRARIQSEGDVCLIEAGYDSGIEVLALADVTRVRVRRDLPDIITMLECGDGAVALRDAKVSLSFEAGATVERVLNRIADELELEGVRETGVEITGQYAEGVAFSGTAKEALNAVTKKAGLTWSIQDGLLQVLDREQGTEGLAVFLSPDSGLLASPERMEDIEQETERPRGEGFRVRSLLNPAIRPGDRIELQSRDVDGAFIVDTVEHSGDTRAQDWFTEAEVYAETD